MKSIKRFFAMLIILQIISPGWVQVFAEEISSWPEYVSNEIIVQYKEEFVDTSDSSEMQTLTSELEQKNITIVDGIPEENIVVMEWNENLFESALARINGISEEERINSILDEYNNNPNVKYAQRNFLYETKNLKFNDEFYSRQWYLENRGEPITGMQKFYKDEYDKDIETIASTEDIDIDYEEAFEIYTKAKNRQSDEEKNKKIVVAVIDSGIKENISDFEGKLWNGENCITWDNKELWNCEFGYNFVYDEATWGGEYNVYANHGTNVSSLIAAKSDNNTGMVGIAPDVEIMSLNVNGILGISTLNTIKAIQFAKHNNADIINLSLGSKRPFALNDLGSVDKLLYLAISGFPGTVVIAAGNESLDLDNNETVIAPAIFGRSFSIEGVDFPSPENVIVVGSEDSEGNISDFSNFWKNTVDIMAPGSNILMAGNDGINTELTGTDYDYNFGTSFSTPIVTGAVAFLKSAYPEKDLSEIKKIILENVETTPNSSEKNKTSGRLNLANSIKIFETEYEQQTHLDGNITLYPNNWTKENVTAVLNTNKYIITPEGWEKITPGEHRRTFSENGKFSLTIKNNFSQQKNINFEIKNIDRKKPEILFVGEKNISTSAENVEIHFSAQDKESGIYGYECKNNENFWTACQSPYNANLENDGLNTILIRAVDKAENFGEISLKITKSADAENISVIGKTKEEPKSTTSQNTSSVGAGGYSGISVNTTISKPKVEIKIENPKVENEEKITLSSAPNEKNNIYNLYNPNPDDIYQRFLYPNIENRIANFIKILDKKWIQRDENAKIENFSIGEKLNFFEEIIKDFEKLPQENTLELKNSSLWNIKKSYQNLLEDWKNGKYFILN